MANEDSADVIVVGTGIVGCLVAEQMLDKGLSVLMLEAGPRVDRWRIVENFRNLPPTLRLHFDAAYPPKAWAPHMESYTDAAAAEYLQLEGPNARAYPIWMSAPKPGCKTTGVLPQTPRGQRT